MTEELNLVEMVNKAEREYRIFKNNLTLEKSIMALEIDWNKVNQARVDQGKPKITNEANRNHYFKVHFAEEDMTLLNLELRFKALDRELQKEMRE